MTQDRFAAQWHDTNDYIEVRTSGSTGEPKTIRLSKHDMAVSARATCRFFGIDATSRLLCPLDYEYIAAKMMYVRAAVSGARLDSIEPSRRLDLAGDYDLIAVVPSQLPSIMESVDAGTLTSRHVIVGGAPLAPGQMPSHSPASAPRLWLTYGMTETASHVALAPLDAATDPTSPLYRALPGITFSVDTRGCLVVHMEGRHTRSVATTDMVHLLTPQTFRWLGRYDNTINSGGVKIHPEPLEAIIKTELNRLGLRYTEVIVTGRPSALWGQEAICLIETESPFSADDAHTLRLGVLRRLDNLHHCPKAFIAVGSLPRTPTGKLIRGSRVKG